MLPRLSTELKLRWVYTVSQTKSPIPNITIDATTLTGVFLIFFIRNSDHQINNNYQIYNWFITLISIFFIPFAYSLQIYITSSDHPLQFFSHFSVNIFISGLTVRTFYFYDVMFFLIQNGHTTSMFIHPYSWSVIKILPIASLILSVWITKVKRTSFFFLLWSAHYTRKSQMHHSEAGYAFSSYLLYQWSPISLPVDFSFLIKTDLVIPFNI